MASTPKKLLSTNTISSNSTGRRPPMNPNRSSSPTPRGASTPSALSTNGIGRTPSTRSPTGVTRPTRASVRRSGLGFANLSNTSTLNISDDDDDENARIENAALIDNLKRSLRNAEIVSEDYQHQLTLLQKKLSEVQREQEKMEDRLHDGSQRIEDLEGQKKEVSRQMRDMQNIYESERGAMMRDRDEQALREAELKSSVQRLKETLAGREMRVNADAERRMSRSGRGHDRSSSVDMNVNGNFAPSLSMQRRDSSSHQRSDSRNNSRVVMQKDQVIESLRLELAGAQIRMAELENMGGDKMHEIERTLLETRMTNARLMEDNESFQLLLGEKTLNGDFTKNDFMHSSADTETIRTSGLGSLAEELESAEGESENYRRLEAETKSLKDQNKALTLYIEKIISRVLQHENFETILDQKPDTLSRVPKSGQMNTQKDLPPPPPKDEEPVPSVLKRAMSVVSGAPARRSRPSSQIITPATQQPPWEGLARKARPMSQHITSEPNYIPTTNEDPSTAPSVPPLGRTASVANRTNGHRRTQSEKSDINNAAILVNQMYKGPPGAAAGGPGSPTLTPGGTTPRTSYFAPPSLVSNISSNSNNLPTTASTRAPSGSRTTSSSRVPSASQNSSTNVASSSEHAASSSNSMFSHSSNGEVPSPPRNNAGNTTYTGAVMTQSKLRPLRLVQENKEMENASQVRRANTGMGDDAETKKNKAANRGSWMGWFNRGKEEGAPRNFSGTSVVD